MIDRSIAPLPAEPKSFIIPRVQKFILSNGIEIFFVHKNNLPIIHASVLIEAGSKFDPANKAGLAYLTSLLIDEGAGEFNALQLSDEFEKMGSILSISADQDYINLSLLSLTENFDHSLYLLGKILTEPKFDEKDYAREKKKVLDKILQLKDDAGYIASTIFEKIVFQKTFYELPELGYSKSVEQISNQDVIDYYRSMFTNNNTKIIAVGNLPAGSVIDQFEKTIGKWNNKLLAKNAFAPPDKPGSKYYIIDKKDSAQCEIRIGHPAKKRTAKDYYATRIMNTILGGQFSSRINLNLREDKGYTYGASSAYSYYKETGLFEIHTAVNIENSADAVKEILKEIDGIRREITEKEIDFAKSFMIKQFPSRFESFSQITRNIETLVIHSLEFSELENFINNIESVTSEEILEAAKENIIPDDLVIVLCGGKNKILSQLKDELNVEPVELDSDGILIIQSNN